MTVKNLSSTSFDELMDCFLESFAGYYVKMPVDPAYYKERWIAAKVDFRLSYGMFDKTKLVGFILHAVDIRLGELTAFNTGTGVIPKYRGQKITKRIYNYALSDLAQNGVSVSTLEVIVDNKIAISTYQSIGFEISRTMKCFGGQIEASSENQFELIEIHEDEMDWEKLPNQELYSWDNQRGPISHGSYKYFEVHTDGVSESYFIIHPDKGYLAQFDLLNGENKGWNELFSAMKTISKNIRVNNVDGILDSKIDALIKTGLGNSVDQYEMKLELNRNRNLEEHKR